MTKNSFSRFAHLPEKALAMPAVFTVALFWLTPLIAVVFFSFYTNNPMGSYDHIFTVENYKIIGSQAFYMTVFLRTVFNAVLVTILCAIIGYPVAYRLARMPERRAAKLLVLIVVPFLTATIFRAYGMIYLLGNRGVINSILTQIGLPQIKLIWNKAGVIIGFLNVLLPYMILTLYTSIAQVARSLEEAASILGANRWQTFFHVVLPLTRSGVVTGCIFVFAIAVGTFEIPAILGGMREMAISMLIQQKVGLMNYPIAGALAISLLVIVLGMFVLLRRLLGGKVIV
jgi:spermidine/putrescine transport system permease protein